MLPKFDNTEIAFRYRTTSELKQARFLFASMSSPAITKIGMTFTKVAINLNLPIKGIVKKTIFRQFCGGETMDDAAVTADMLSEYGVGVILDYGVEGNESEEEFDRAVLNFIKAIKYASSKKNIPFISIKVTGFGRFALLEKLNNKEPLTKEEQDEWQRVQQRIDKICATAHDENVIVLVDAEETWIQDPVNYLANMVMEKYNREKAVVYNTFQLYTTDALPYLEASYEEATKKGYILGAKLVRGAYMEKERARAAEKGYTSPIQPDKVATDRDYNKAAHFCLQRIDHMAVFIGTHNEHSCMEAVRYMKDHHIPPQTHQVWFSQLYGMSDNISFNLADSGYQVAKYLPYGPVKDVLPYLMRRAEENTSVAGQTGRELSLINKELKRRSSIKS